MTAKSAKIGAMASWRSLNWKKRALAALAAVYFAVMVPIAFYGAYQSAHDMFKDEVSRRASVQALQMIVTPGLLWSGPLVKFGLHPWQVSVTLCFLVTVLSLAGAFRRARKRPLRLLNAALAVVSLGVGASIYLDRQPVRDADAEIIDSAFVVGRYMRADRELVFIGQQHIADLPYYEHLDGKLADLTAANFKFFYENATAAAARPSLALAGNTTTYGLPWRRFYIDVLHQPDSRLWPSAKPSDWTAVDLPADSPQIAALAHVEDDKAFCVKMHEARDKHLLEQINESREKKLAVVYGLNHFLHLKDRLLQSGWVPNGTAEELPHGRSLPPISDYCT